MALSISEDLRAEMREFHAFLETLSPEDWKRETRFMGWTPWDVVAHLHYFDRVSLAAIEGEQAFAAHRDELMAAVSQGQTTKALQDRAFAGVSAEALLERWRAGCEALADALGACAPKTRLPWFGPDMGVPMFTTARYMETWAHAQAVYDLLGAERPHSDRIRNIVAIGVRTFGWTFVNRKLDPPGSPPFVRLVAPSGEVWEYNDPSDVERIEGPAVDFCMTVTQTRNVKDTALEVTGDVANAWMEIAQCFAGAPVDPPPPGYRTGG